MAVCGVNHASPVVCVRAQVVGCLTAVGTVVPEPTVPTLLRVRSVVARACSSINGWHYTSRLGPLYQFTFQLNVFDDVVDVGCHLGSFEVFLDIDTHLGNLPFFFVIFMPLS